MSSSRQYNSHNSYQLPHQRSYSAKKNNLNPEDQNKPQLKESMLNQYINDLKFLASQKKQGTKKSQISQNQQLSSVKKQTNKNSTNMKNLSLLNQKQPQPNNFSKSKSSKFQDSLIKQLSNMTKGFLMGEDTNTEVALKQVMSSVRQSDDKLNSKNGSKSRSRAQSTKATKRSNSNQLDTSNSKAIQKKNSIILGNLGLDASQFSHKFKCYIDSFQRSSTRSNKKNLGNSLKKKDSSSGLIISSDVKAKDKIRSNSFNKFVSPQRQHQQDIYDQPVSDSYQIDKKALEQFKTHIKDLRGKGKPESISQTQKPDKSSHLLYSNSKSNKKNLTDKQIRQNYNSSNNQYNNQPQLHHITESTDLNSDVKKSSLPSSSLGQGPAMIQSLEQRKFYTNQLNSNTQNSNTLYSLQYMQQKANDSLNPMNILKSMNNIQGATAVSESLNRADIISFNMNDLSSAINQAPIFDIEELHDSIVKGIQLSKKIVVEKDKWNEKEEGGEQEGNQGSNFNQKLGDKRKKNKSRCAQRKQSQTVVFYEGEEIIGGDMCDAVNGYSYGYYWQQE